MVVVGIAALAVLRWPRRLDLLTMAALSGALMVAVELTLTHWFYLYIPWFLPFALLAMVPDWPPPGRPQRAAPGPARAPAREPVPVPVGAVTLGAPCPGWSSPWRSSSGSSRCRSSGSTTRAGSPTSRPTSEAYDAHRRRRGAVRRLLPRVPARWRPGSSGSPGRCPAPTRPRSRASCSLCLCATALGVLALARTLGFDGRRQVARRGARSPSARCCSATWWRRASTWRSRRCSRGRSGPRRPGASAWRGGCWRRRPCSSWSRWRWCRRC